MLIWLLLLLLLVLLLLLLSLLLLLLFILLLFILLTSMKIHINDKTKYKNQSLQLGLFIPNSKQNI